MSAVRQIFSKVTSQLNSRRASLKQTSKRGRTNTHTTSRQSLEQVNDNETETEISDNESELTEEVERKQQEAYEQVSPSQASDRDHSQKLIFIGSFERKLWGDKKWQWK